MQKPKLTVNHDGDYILVDEDGNKISDICEKYIARFAAASMSAAVEETVRYGEDMDYCELQDLSVLISELEEKANA